MANDVEHPFMWLSAIFIFSSVECLLISFAHFQTQLFVFLQLSFDNFVYILDTYSFKRTLQSTATWGFLSSENHYHQYRNPQWLPKAKRMSDQCAEGGLISRDVDLCA